MHWKVVFPLPALTLLTFLINFIVFIMLHLRRALWTDLVKLNVIMCEWGEGGMGLGREVCITEVCLEQIYHRARKFRTVG